MKHLLTSPAIHFTPHPDTCPVINPATLEAVAYVRNWTNDALITRLELTQKAQKKWAQETALTRADLLLKWHHLLLEHKETLAAIITTEQGKTLGESRGEVAYAASFIRFFAEECRRNYGDIIPGPARRQRLLVLKQPVGVCAAITPWNFPAAMITRKAAPALACGCAIVAKPAPQTPLTAYALERLALDAGIPEHLFSVITGDAATLGATLCASPVVRKISFTGSTATGKLLMAQSAATIKKLSLELGGNAPFIVFEDADLDAAIKGIMASKFRNSGQTCICANRIYVQNSIYDQVHQLLRTSVQQLKVGNGLEPDIHQGPLINAQAVAKVQAHIADALAKGAQLSTGGKSHFLGGHFFEPTILTRVQENMQIAQEETFGPVAPLFSFDNETEVIERANNTPFGLAAYCYTQSTARQWRVAEALEYGMVGINTGLLSNEVSPFGGIKQSGLGREGSAYGMDEYLELKYLCIDISDPS